MSDKPVDYRSEALGAFAHEFRTPLTAIKMVMELGRRAGLDGSIVLESDIAGMLDESMDGLEVLADGIQALSWLERGKLKLDTAPTSLKQAVESARSRIGGEKAVVVLGVDGITGPWDAERLPAALAHVIDAAARCGGGDVTLSAASAAACTTVSVVSGEPGGDPRPINADLGFDFFAACLTLEYGHAAVHCTRASRYLRVDIELPN